METKNNELTNIKQKLRSSDIIIQELSQKIEDLEMNKKVFATKASEPVQDVIDEP